MKQLTARQFEVACHIDAGKTQAVIAKLLKVRAETIKKHAADIYRVLDVTGAQELTRKYHHQLSGKRLESLAGFWLSRFEYKSRSLLSTGDPYIASVQINLECLSEESDKFFTHRGVSVCSSPSTKRPFDHVLLFKEEERVLAGIWQNTNTQNMGCMQLVTHNGGLIMRGMHLGNTSDATVSSGEWTWRKIQASAGSVVATGEPNFKKFDELEKFFEEPINPRQVIPLQDLFAANRL